MAHLPVDVKTAKTDFYVFSGHKMYGPDGVGVLYVNDDIRHLITPVRPGGGTVRDIAIAFGQDYDVVSPDYDGSLSILNGGTPNTSNIVGLAKAIGFLQTIGWKAIREHEARLTRKLITGLAGIDAIEIYGPNDIDRKIGLVSFALPGFDIKEIAAHLASQNICVRYGAHCALPLSDRLGKETLRVSLGIYNNDDDIDLFLKELRAFLASKTSARPHSHLKFFKNICFAQHSHLVSSKRDILDLLDSIIDEKGQAEVAVMGGHFLGIPSLRDNQPYPSIEGILPAHPHQFAEEFGTTSFPLYTFDLATDVVCELKAKGIKAKVLIVATDTTGINELRLSSANVSTKTAEQYRDELLSMFEQDHGLPNVYWPISQQRAYRWMTSSSISKNTIFARRFYAAGSRNSYPTIGNFSIAS